MQVSAFGKAQFYLTIMPGKIGLQGQRREAGERNRFDRGITSVGSRPAYPLVNHAHKHSSKL